MAKNDLVSLAELEAWLAGEDYVPPAEPKPEPAQQQTQPTGRPMPQTILTDERSTFQDLLRGRGVKGGQQVDYQQRPQTNSFVAFLGRVYRDKAQQLKDALDKV